MSGACLPLHVRPLLALGALVLLGLLTARPLGAVLAPEGEEHPVRAPATVEHQAATPRPAVDVLRAWDLRRAAAYASGDVAALRRLYVPGSAVGRADVRLLRSYAARGLVVRGMRMQLLAVTRQRTGDASLLRLRVVDRLVGASAVPVGEPQRSGQALPSDRPSVRLLELRRIRGRWLVADVSAARPRAGR